MVVYQGTIVTHEKEPYTGQISIDNDSGLITAVASMDNPLTEDPERIFDQNRLIFPGMGDIHIHAREDDTGKQLYKEEYLTAADAALNGGLAHVAAMPNTPNPLTEKDHLRWHRDRIHGIDHPVTILNYIGIGPGDRPIGKPGEHPYKAFFGKSVGNLTFYDEDELEATLKHYRGHHISFHVEYEPFVEASKDGRTHSERRPIGAVNHGLKLLLPLIEKYGINAKLCHWSTGGESFKMIEEHRDFTEKNGLPYTTIEVSPLHLLFDTSMTDDDPSLWLKIQMNPAIQGPKHRQELINGLRNGFIDYIATDHAPHTLEEKHAAFAKFQNDHPDLNTVEIAAVLARKEPEMFAKTCCENGMSGAPWLDTYASVVSWLLAEQDFSPRDIARVTAYNPGEFINKYLGAQSDKEFGKGFGRIEPGYVGSLTVIDTDSPRLIRKDGLHTKVGWSPLEGMSFPGGLEMMIIRGKEHRSGE